MMVAIGPALLMLEGNRFEWLVGQTHLSEQIELADGSDSQAKSLALS